MWLMKQLLLEISIYGVKIKKQPVLEINLLICSYFGESKSYSAGVLYKPRILSYSWETGFILYS